MTRPLSDLPLLLRKYKAQITAAVNKTVENAAIGAGQYLAKDSPVDTGAFRSNWVMTLDRPFEGTIGAYAPFPKLGVAALTGPRKGEGLNLSGVIVQHSLAAQAFDMKVNRTIYIRNNLEYAGKIQQGHSPQTPAGILQRGVTAGARAARGGTWRLP